MEKWCVSVGGRPHVDVAGLVENPELLSSVGLRSMKVQQNGGGVGRGSSFFRSGAASQAPHWACVGRGCGLCQRSLPGWAEAPTGLELGRAGRRGFARGRLEGCGPAPLRSPRGPA